MEGPTPRDIRYMNAALHEARKGLGRTSPNPSVGAVVVRDDRIVGRGHTTTVHAEVAALDDAGEAARGAEVFVNLEPCSHYGRNPPCTDRLISAGVRRVVAGIIDPNPLVNGRGIRALEEAGIEVHRGVLEAECAAINAPFFKYISTGTPWVTAKYAMTLDGRIASRTGDSKWISGERSRREAHRLRDQNDAILVGTHTLERDDPSLTTRTIPGGRDPIRVVLDPRGEIRTDANVLTAKTSAATWIVCAPENEASLRRRLGTREDLEVLPIETGDDGRIDLVALLRALAARRVMMLLVEGGGATLGSLFAVGQIDEVAVFVAPKLIGGDAAVGPIGGPGVPTIAAGAQLADVRLERFDDDIYITGRVRREGGR